MEFKEQFRQKYRVALHAARANDTEGTLKGLAGLCELFASQYALNNGDSIVTKVKLSYWQGIFGGYINIIRQYGLKDRRVQKLFGLIDDNTAPSLGDIMSGNGDLDLPPVNLAPVHAGGIDISGIDDPAPEKTYDRKPPKADNPTEPQAPAAHEEYPVAPASAQPEQPQTTAEPAPPVTPTAPQPVRSQGNGGGNDEPTFAPTSLENFIGQQHIVKVLLKEIAIAKAQDRKYLDNILLLGNPGLGKTTLMSLIADALGVKFELMDCAQCHNSKKALKALQNFLMKVARENEPVVIAFDEIHMLTPELQSSLLTLLNNRVYVSPPDINGNIKRIPIDNFTFIAATTDDDKVLNTVKDRCLRLKFQMVDYTPEELKRIYKNKIASMGLTATDEALDSAIPRSRGSIRYIDAFIEGFRSALYDENGQLTSTEITLDTVKKYFAEKGIDEIGLEKKDLEILNVLAEDATGTMSAETLSARVGLEPKKYQSEYEPYLIKIGFITVTGRGRRITDKAVEHLKKQREEE